MIKLIAGIILLLAPFLLVTLFKDKKRGFVYILFFLIAFHSLLALFTQFFGIFYYGVILGANLLAVFGLLITSLRGAKRRSNLNNVREIASLRLAMTKKIDWFVFIVAVISVITLYQVHYNYTGKFNMVNDGLYQYHEAENMKYEYPYFSDEWYAVSLAKEAINNNSLPLKNPFDNNFFINPEIVFHSFIAEIALFLGLDLLTQYIALSIFINTLIIILAYLFLRISNVSKFASAVSSLSILYITSASNLPGIWNLIPITMGIVFTLLGFCFMSSKLTIVNFDVSMVLLAGIFTVMFYPPLIIFAGTGFAAYFFNFYNAKEKIFGIIKLLIILLLIIAVLFVILLLSPMAGAANYIFSNLFYNSFTGDFMPRFNFYFIIPWFVILLAVFGINFVFENKKWLFYQLILGFMLWIFYSFSVFRIILGFERTIFFTSIILALISGFGIEKIINYISSKFGKIAPALKYIEAFVLILFLLLIPFYTQGENWKNLTLSNYFLQVVSVPMAPANNYLTSDDLRIFKNIQYKKFLSFPWKGTVIGTATENYPIETKGGTITMNPGLHRQFINSDCDKKYQIAKEKNIDYIYSSPFLCDNFQEIDKSSEGFAFYKILY